MLRLRPYKLCDAEVIASWVKDELTLRRWSADRFGEFPVTAEDINKKYIDNNGDCVEQDNFYPMTAFDDSGIAGHLIMRFIDEEKRVIRFGFVIIDDSRRGTGCGGEMIRLAVKYAFEILGAEKITIGAFESNPAAYRCYKKAGFNDAEQDEPIYYSVMGEQWRCLELEMSKS